MYFDKGIRMENLTIKCVDAFTTRPFCGNPAGVITEADGLTEEIMQSIASGMKMNLIEIAFVTSPETENASYRIRFFTPSKELDISGHVMIAACQALIEEGKIKLNNGLTTVHFNTKIGEMPVEIYFHEDNSSGILSSHDENNTVQILTGKNKGILEKIMIHEPIYNFRCSNVPVKDIACVLGIDEGEITKTGLPVVTASYDLEWLIIPVQNKETILNMHPDLIKLGILNRKYGILTNHIFTLDTFSRSCITYSRNFGPAMGLWEDPASANGAAGLGAYLLKYGVTTSGSMIMEQGKEVDSLARILVEIDHKDGETSSVRVGGLAVTSITRQLSIESGEIIIV